MRTETDTVFAPPRPDGTTGPSRVSLGESLFSMPSVAVIRRELLTVMRGGQAFVWLVVLIAVSSYVVYANWPAQGVRVTASFPGGATSVNPGSGLRTSPVGAPTGMTSAQVSRRMFLRVSMALLLGCVLFVPALSGGAITLEREQETLEQLSVTLASPAGIVLAKLLNAVGMYVLMVIAAAPVAGTVFLSVGLDWVQIAAVLAVLLATAFFCAAIGLLCSSFFRRSRTALLASYVAMLSLLFGISRVLLVPLMMFGFSRFRYGSPRGLLSLLGMRGSPLGLLEVALLGKKSPLLVVPSIVWYLIQAAICLLIARYFLQRRAYLPVKELSEKPIDDPNALFLRRQTFPYYLIDPLKRKRPIPDGLNPMTVREFYWGVFRNTSFMVRLFYVTLIVFFLGAARVAWFSNSVGDAELWIGTMIAMIILVVPALVASAFTKEREQGNTDLLRMTLLGPGATVRGKVCGGLLSLSPVVLAGILANLSILIHGWPAVEILLRGYATLLVCVLFSVLLCTCVSLSALNSTTATVASYFLLAVFFLGVPAFVLFFTRFPRFTDTWAFTSPIGAYAGSGGTLHWLGSMALFVVASIGLYFLAGSEYRRCDK